MNDRVIDMGMDTNADGVLSRRWPVTIRNYFFGQRPSPERPPDIARLFSISAPVPGARNFESWTMLTDLAPDEAELISRLSHDTRKQVRRAQRENVAVERLNCRNPEAIEGFGQFWNRFVASKADVRSALDVSVKLHMLRRLADASMLEMTRASDPDGEPLVYHVLIVAEKRARVLHSASLFRDGDQSSAQRHFAARANRLVHWQNILHYRARGCTHYDMGGWYSGTEDESLLRVNQFKEEFGGYVVREFDAMYGCTPLGNNVLPFRDVYIAVRESLRRVFKAFRGSSKGVHVGNSDCSK